MPEQQRLAGESPEVAAGSEQEKRPASMLQSLRSMLGLPGGSDARQDATPPQGNAEDIVRPSHAEVQRSAAARLQSTVQMQSFPQQAPAVSSAQQPAPSAPPLPGALHGFYTSTGSSAAVEEPLLAYPSLAATQSENRPSRPAPRTQWMADSMPHPQAQPQPQPSAAQSRPSRQGLAAESAHEPGQVEAGAAAAQPGALGWALGGVQSALQEAAAASGAAMSALLHTLRWPRKDAEQRQVDEPSAAASSGATDAPTEQRTSSGRSISCASHCTLPLCYAEAVVHKGLRRAVASVCMLPCRYGILQEDEEEEMHAHGRDNQMDEHGVVALDTQMQSLGLEQHSSMGPCAVLRYIALQINLPTLT